jgi:hypothetical protein
MRIGRLTRLLTEVADAVAICRPSRRRPSPEPFPFEQTPPIE